MQCKTSQIFLKTSRKCSRYSSYCDKREDSRMDTYWVFTIGNYFYGKINPAPTIFLNNNELIGAYTHLRIVYISMYLLEKIYLSNFQCLLNKRITFGGVLFIIESRYCDGISRKLIILCTCVRWARHSLRESCSNEYIHLKRYEGV